ncbi:hypothetical protein XENOCAPTIV_009935, partial [Xenoophorus captivus]
LTHPPGVRLEPVVKIFPFKSLKCLEELLSLCGGDLSSALPWLELHTLNFSYNSIICLDQSLSLLNVLKSLDLSHNKIQECEEFLKPLSELEHLNLGYNCLQRAPALSPTARAKLHTLILRNNELETINGKEHWHDWLDFLSSWREVSAPVILGSWLMEGLILEGNPLYFQKTHRTCTVGHLSPKAAKLRLRLDGTPLTSSELSVLPQAGQLIQGTDIQVQTSLPVFCDPPERRSQEPSSGAGELSDSLSVSEAGMSRFRRKKCRSKVKVRRASISEPSDTDHEPRPISSTHDIVLPHQQEIERMSSFRDQLGEDWLRYQHHLDGGTSTTITTTIGTSQPTSQTLTNGISTSKTRLPSDPGHHQLPPLPPVEILDVLPPPLLSSETNQMETESTLQWLSQSTQQTESTLEASLVDGPAVKKEAGGSHQSSPNSQRSVRTSSGGTNQEEEDELGVDLCRPLLVGVLLDKQEMDSEGQEKKRIEMFLRIKQGVLLEVDMQRGMERCRLELDSLARVETTQAVWTREDTEGLFPALELHFDYIVKAKRRRCYVLLDDDPQQAAQVLTDILSVVVEENQRRDSELVPGGARLQCLRCRSEFTSHVAAGEEEDAGGGGGRRGNREGAMLPDGEDGRYREEQTEADYFYDSTGEGDRGWFYNYIFPIVLKLLILHLNAGTRKNNIFMANVGIEKKSSSQVS